MSTRVCKCNGNEDDRLPMFRRTIRITAELWKEVKAHGKQGTQGHPLGNR